MRTIKASNYYKKCRKLCKKRGLNLGLLDAIEDILVSRDFTSDEIFAYKVHSLTGDYKGYMELHIGGRNSDWVLIYKITGNTVEFDSTEVYLHSTGTHSDLLENYKVDTDLIWL